MGKWYVAITRPAACFKNMMYSVYMLQAHCHYVPHKQDVWFVKNCHYTSLGVSASKSLFSIIVHARYKLCERNVRYDKSSQWLLWSLKSTSRQCKCLCYLCNLNGLYCSVKYFVLVHNDCFAFPRLRQETECLLQMAVPNQCMMLCTSAGMSMKNSDQHLLRC